MYGSFDKTLLGAYHTWQIWNIKCKNVFLSKYCTVNLGQKVPWYHRVAESIEVLKWAVFVSVQKECLRES